MKWALLDFADKDVVFIGHGREGQSFERFIQQHGRISSFRFVDQSDGPSYLEELGTLEQDNTVVVKTPGCPGRLVPVAYTTPTNLFFNCVRQTGARVVGVTGTKGKSTTTALIGKILTQAGQDAILCGNIGLPMLDALDCTAHRVTDASIFVVELSSYQLEDLMKSPDVAVITNLYEDHVPYHGSLAKYWDAKRNIMRFMSESGIVVFNPDFQLVGQWVSESSCAGVAIDPRTPVDMSNWNLWGEHNRLNSLAAVAVTRFLGVPEADALAAICTFEALPHRMQRVRSVSGVMFIDNAIGGNPAATIAAIKAVEEHGDKIGCLMLGGEDRDYNFSELAASIHESDIPNLILFPETGTHIRNELPNGYAPECLETTDVGCAVNWAARHCPEGSVCLLSPASPSQTISTDFEDMGNMFKEAVASLGRLGGVMKMKFSEIEEAFEFVSFGEFVGDHSAVLDRAMGKVYWRSELGDFDEVPDEVWESDACVAIPDKRDLDLGNRLVFRFVRSVVADEEGRVRGFFSGRGAYARYKDWLESNGLLQQWYDFEATETEKALREWCLENGVELESSREDSKG